MVSNVSTGARPMNDASQTLDARSDNELLVAIAGQRDRAAFDELFRRYEKPSYNLAWNLTGNRERAAEAVQEALLRVWLRAANFRPDGKARGWILRIVVRESLRTARKRSGESMQDGYDLDAHADAPKDAGADGIVVEERLATLRASIEHLPLGYRRILALYYGAGLTQKEIGEELNVSQRTVSAHLDESLKRLRQMLAQAGVAAAAPLLAPDALGTAFVSGQTPAPGLGAALAERLADSALEAGRTLSRKAASSVIWPVGWIVVLAALVLGGAGLWLVTGRSGVEPGAKAPVPTPRSAEETSPALDASKPAPPKPGVLGHWVFDKEPPKGFEVVRGSWTWQAAQDGKPGCMHAPGRVWILPPVKLPDGLPVRVALRFGVPDQSRGFMYDLYLTDGETFPDRIVCTLMGKSHISRREEIQMTEFILGRYVAASITGEGLNFVQEYPEPVPNGPICLALVNVDLRELEIRTLAGDEVPTELRDIQSAIVKIGEPMRPALGGPLRRDD